MLCCGCAMLAILDVLYEELRRCDVPELIWCRFPRHHRADAALAGPTKILFQAELFLKKLFWGKHKKWRNKLVKHIIYA